MDSLTLEVVASAASGCTATILGHPLDREPSRALAALGVGLFLAR